MLVIIICINCINCINYFVKLFIKIEHVYKKTIKTTWRALWSLNYQCEVITEKIKDGRLRRSAYCSIR